ncbi:MFS transporter [Planctomycetaceae bacterium SCGC AG-212-D15]|nr:MFS transporter [Planctomycetaceae bacterium SCGC AG-212-D15]
MVTRALRGLIDADAFRHLSADGWLLFGTRCARLFGYGLFSVVLVLYLSAAGLDDTRIGLLLTLTLLGDTAISLWLTTSADRFGRRRTLLAGAFLMIFAGTIFAVTNDFWLLLLAATIGVISPSGNEVGPFLSVEQAALAHTVPGDQRTGVFAWYNLVGSLATALGALCGGLVTQVMMDAGVSGPQRYQPLAIVYSLIGVVLALAFTRLSPNVEVSPIDASAEQKAPPTRFGLHRSGPIVLKLSGLFALDAFSGGFVVQSIMAYWFFLRFDVEPAALGALFFGANILAGLSSLAAAGLARRIGLVNTMVFTHLPSNVLLILVPLMPTAWLAGLVLLVRFSISQMDVPARQSYTMAVVSPDERSAASGVTNVARSLGAAVSPMLATVLVGTAPLMNIPFYFAGGIKIIYDLLLYRSFVGLRPAEEQ